MIAPAEQTGETLLAEAYRAADRALRVRQAKVGYGIALIGLLVAIGLDYSVYPSLLMPFLRVRLVCAVAMVISFALQFTPLAMRWALVTEKPCVLLPTLAVCWMVYDTAGGQSPYYAGLNLMIIGACALIPYRAPEAALVCSGVVGLYLLACAMHRLFPPHRAHSSVDTGLLLNNLYFMGVTSTIGTVACYHSSRRRFAEFRLRHELDVNNKTLATTLARLKETEVQLVQSEKMNALGKLSAGLLHEINNPLNFTFMALQVAKQDIPAEAAVQETLADIEQGMTRIRGVIADLRAFAYPSKVADQHEFCLDETLTTALRLTAQEVGTIPVEREGLQRDKVVGAKTQIVHVFMNLLVNSAHALKAAGPGRPPRIVVSCTPVGDRVRVSVRDNGVGVKAADLPRLFEPFFTTKAPGEGTGLGLSICHTIIDNHGGQITVTSEEGKGTEVCFDLPSASVTIQRPSLELQLASTETALA